MGPRLPLGHDLAAFLVTVRYSRWSAACAECLRVRQAITPGPISIFFLFLLLTDVPEQASGTGLRSAGSHAGAMLGATEARPVLPRYRSRSAPLEPCLDVRSRSQSRLIRSGLRLVRHDR